MKVGFLGIQCDNDNLGVCALAYAGIGLVDQVVPQQAEFVIFSDNSPAGIDRMRRELGMAQRHIRAVPFRHKSPSRLRRSIHEITSCDLVIDFSGGDSFSDIYGLRRIVKLLFHKQIAILGNTPLVLAPQTYGPFRHRLLLPWVRHVLRRASLVFSRDTMSRDHVATMTRREVILTTDVAVRLPWQPAATGPRERLLVGFNVSGLLWAGGYTGDNQFGLRADYREYCDRVVGSLLALDHDVALVAHVQSAASDSIEDDLQACRDIGDRHPRAFPSPRFASPVEAKSYISGTDVFIGSRMHATIAAFTAGIPTIPVAYSRKFRGFYDNLGHPEGIDLRHLPTDEAVERTLGLVEQRDELRIRGAASNVTAQELIEAFPDRIRALVERG